MWRYVGWQNSIVSRRSLRMDEDSSLHTVFGWAKRFWAGGIGEKARLCEAPVSFLMRIASGGVGISMLARPRLSSSESLTSGGVDGAEEGRTSIEGVVEE